MKRGIFGGLDHPNQVCLDGACRTILYTGDLGRPTSDYPGSGVMDQAITCLWNRLTETGTYDVEDTKRQLEETVNRTWNAGANLVVPVFD